MLKPSHRELLSQLYDSSHRKTAWVPVFDAIANDGLRVDAKIPPKTATLMHMATQYYTTTIMSRLLALGAPSDVCDHDGFLPMHWCVFWYTGNMLEKCKLLPVATIAAVGRFGVTPLSHVLCKISIEPSLLSYYRNVLLWMLEQPQCPLLARCSGHATALEFCKANKLPACIVDAITAASVIQARWTAARAVWVAACAKIQCI